MPAGRPARRIVLESKLREKLTALSRSTSSPFRVVMRARIICLAADGRGNKEIAKDLKLGERTVGKWRRRFADDPRSGVLDDALRSGRPPQVDMTVRLHLVKLACRRPEGNKSPFRDIWTQQALADALLVDTGVRLSRSEVRRILDCEGLRPHRVRQWLHSPDPDFAAKVERICGLYLSPPSGAQVLCIDEKPMQALGRKHPTRIGPRAVVRYEYEYKRHGTRPLLAAFNVADGTLFGQVRPNRKADTLVSFMNDVAKRYPDGDVYVVWDNLNIHHDGPGNRWSKFNAEHGGRFHFVYTPLHASWVNQVEVWFSILERRVLRHGNFAGPQELADTVHGFIRYWNSHEAHPFRWTFRGRFEQSRQGRVA